MQTSFCKRCGQTLPQASSPDEPRAYEMSPESKLCVFCGQPRPYPTQPGLWRYRRNRDAPWCSVEIVRMENGGLAFRLEKGDARALNEVEDYVQWEKAIVKPVVPRSSKPRHE